MPVATAEAEHAAWQTVELTHRDGSTATVQGLGAHVTSWRDAARGEQLFMSRLSPMQVGAPIVGGIGVSFPFFTSEQELSELRQQVRGTRLEEHFEEKEFETKEASKTRPPGPALGLARSLVWRVVDSEKDDSRDPWVSLAVRDNAETSVLWPHAFELQARITLASSAIDVELTVRNTAGPAPSPVYRPPSAYASPLYASQTAAHSFSFQAALRNYLAVNPAPIEPTDAADEAGGAEGGRGRGAPSTPFSLPGSQRPRSQDQRASALAFERDTAAAVNPAPEGTPTAAEEEPAIDPKRLAEIRAKPASEMTREEMDLDARARVRRRHRHLAEAQKARQKSTAQGLKQAKEALRDTVLGAVVSGFGGCTYTDLDEVMIHDALTRKEEMRRQRRESGEPEMEDEELEWERRGEVQPDSHGLVRAYLNVPERRSVSVRCGERHCQLARCGFPDVGVSNCGAEREVDLPTMHTSGCKSRAYCWRLGCVLPKSAGNDGANRGAAHLPRADGARHGGAAARRGVERAAEAHPAPGARAARAPPDAARTPGAAALRAVRGARHRCGCAQRGGRLDRFRRRGARAYAGRLAAPGGPRVAYGRPR